MELYRFFDSIDGEDERYYTADEFAEYFEQVISSGILNGGANLQVVCSGTDMSVQIKEGYAWLGGYLYKIDAEPLRLTLEAADPSLDRTDRIVIRLDKRLERRYVRAFVLKGMPGEEPTAPGLTRDENIFEIALAQVLIVAGKSFIEGYQITDERFDSEVCGLANSLITVDTTGLFEQFQAWFNSKTAEPDGEFYAQWKDWFDEIRDNSNLVTMTQFNQHVLDYQTFKALAASKEYVDARVAPRLVVLTAAGGISASTDGAEKAQIAGAYHDYFVLKFSNAVNNCAFYNFVIPPDYQAGEAMIKLYWTAPTKNTGAVVWNFAVLGRTSGDDWETPLGEPLVRMQTTAVSPMRLNVCAFDAFNPGWAAGDVALVKISREATSGSDTLAEEAYFLQATIEYTGR